jgi:hypothetical protein
MKRITVVAFAVLCLCMAATANASAHEFHASSLGAILGLSTNTQLFTTPGGTVDCAHAVTTGTVTQLLGKHQLVNVAYLNCTAGGGLATAHVSTAHYLLSADGLAAILLTIKILVLKTFLTPHCTITVGPQNLGTVKFDSNGTDILQLSEVHSIKSVSTGEPCGGTNEETTNGTYTGSNLVKLDGGSLGWL